MYIYIYIHLFIYSYVDMCMYTRIHELRFRGTPLRGDGKWSWRVRPLTSAHCSLLVLTCAQQYRRALLNCTRVLKANVMPWSAL